ncbi:antibiotic biosynthesis monooxygenase [Aquisalimonas sp. 2447]|uniref:antibiotic biosynthesis monooxygenase family protein n=1 Tax=Aquisalimonas sp. 2447 TaxID=2740807 RepID=UPI0014327047|nr:antibiotic biosynthesis monooxygenase [Aquisalimonas sp. 2447]QIT55374.1 antibiotic biosynthesis monooxygenase [Aquisalimonas sp. 2447]
MYQVTNRVFVAPGWEDAFEERFRQRAGRIHHNPGFVRMEVLRPEADGLPYLVQSVWQSKEAFDAWVGSEDFRAAHADPLPQEAFSRGSEMERHAVVVAAP